MMFLLARRLFVLSLAAFVTLGLSLSSIPTSAMPAMTMSGKMDMPDHPDCPNCKDNANTGKALACSSFCVAAVMAVLPGATSLISGLKTITAAKRVALPHGRSAPPDPYPPRPTLIG